MNTDVEYYASFLKLYPNSDYLSQIKEKLVPIERERFDLVDKASLEELTAFRTEFRKIYYDSALGDILSDTGIKKELYLLLDDLNFKDAQRIGTLSAYEKYYKSTAASSKNKVSAIAAIGKMKGPGSREYLEYLYDVNFPQQEGFQKKRQIAPHVLFLNMTRYSKYIKDNNITLTRKIRSGWAERYSKIESGGSFDGNPAFAIEYIRKHCGNADNAETLWIYGAGSGEFLMKVECSNFEISKTQPLSITLSAPGRELLNARHVLFSAVELKAKMSLSSIESNEADVKLANEMRQKYPLETTSSEKPEKFLLPNGEELILVSLSELDCDIVCTEYLILTKSSDGEIVERGHVLTSGLNVYMDVDLDGIPELKTNDYFEMGVLKLYPFVQKLRTLSLQ